jgi:hypothetical protein
MILCFKQCMEELMDAGSQWYLTYFIMEYRTGDSSSNSKQQVIFTIMPDGIFHVSIQYRLTRTSPNTLQEGT